MSLVGRTGAAFWLEFLSCWGKNKREERRGGDGDLYSGLCRKEFGVGGFEDDLSWVVSS